MTSAQILGNGYELKKLSELTNPKQRSSGTTEKQASHIHQHLKCTLGVIRILCQIEYRYRPAVEQICIIRDISSVFVDRMIILQSLSSTWETPLYSVCSRRVVLFYIVILISIAMMKNSLKKNTDDILSNLLGVRGKLRTQYNDWKNVQFGSLSLRPATSIDKMISLYDKYKGTKHNLINSENCGPSKTILGKQKWWCHFSETVLHRRKSCFKYT